MNVKKILIAVDNSTCSEKAARTGYDIARTFSAEVALVNIIEPVPATISPDLTLAPVFLETYDNSEENSHLLLREIETKYSHGITTTYLSVLDSPAHGIVKQAEEWSASLIVIGTYGRTGLYHFLMGSVAEEVARKSTCPVLIVPNKFEDKEQESPVL
ncbi:universal stress protein family [Pedobacter sp. BAL39]|uniref:universal stress protein n=1 Tax=Pedobacter sp. BAL39 TaxID=391596 RepID=UPI0001559C7B|nr:universal stress protein [Pedobacter sp. BAL39]EDM38684.1 universal stress protein family [Pedobacter sp. BAL39]